MKRSRGADDGAIAIIVAFSLVVLFGVAALAVDSGFAYTRRMKLQAVADAAALAGARGGLSTSRVDAVAAANYPSATVSRTASGSQMQVTMSISQPWLFASALGFGRTRTVTATATAVAIPVVPAIMALGAACGDPGSVRINAPGITITGNVSSAGGITYNNSSIVTNGSATYANASCPSNDGSSTITGGMSQGSIGTDPFSGTTVGSFSCDYGNLNPGVDQTWVQPTNDGVYCAGGTLNFIWGTSITRTVTLVARGQIIIAGTGGTLTAAIGGLLAYSEAALDCPASQAIQVGNNTINLAGSFYAPNGCLNMNASGMTVTGALIAKAVQIQAGVGTSSITGPSGTSAGSAYLLN